MLQNGRSFDGAVPGSVARKHSWSDCAFRPVDRSDETAIFTCQRQANKNTNRCFGKSLWIRCSKPGSSHVECRQFTDHGLSRVFTPIQTRARKLSAATGYELASPAV